MDLNYAWSINLEISGRALFTDYLDDVSGVYANPDDLLEARGELAVLLADRSYEVNEFLIGEGGRQRGDARPNDSYVMVGIGLVYNFSSIKCPTF